MKIRQRKLEAQGIDISPLIDMVFILLIFFMVSTTFVKDNKIDIDRPGASTSEMAADKAIRIGIDKQGKVYIDNEEVRPWVIQSIIREKISSDKDTPILVVTDKSVHSGLLIEVIDSCRLAGATDIGVATEGEGS